MSAKVIQLRKPRTFTTAEALIEEVRKELFSATKDHPYSVMAQRCGVSSTTIGNLARGKTAWPRPNTMNAVLRELGLKLKLERQ